MTSWMLQAIYTVFHFLRVCISMYCGRMGVGAGGRGRLWATLGSCLLSVWCWQQDLWPHSHSRLVSMPLSPPRWPVRVCVPLSVFVLFCFFLFLSGPPPNLPPPPAFPLIPIFSSLWQNFLQNWSLPTSSGVPACDVFPFVFVLFTCLSVVPMCHFDGCINNYCLFLAFQTWNKANFSSQLSFIPSSSGFLIVHFTPFMPDTGKVLLQCWRYLGDIFYSLMQDLKRLKRQVE